MEQLQESKDKVFLLRATIEDLDVHASQLSTQVIEARKEVTLAIDEVIKARYEAVAAREVARAAKNVAVATADDAQDISLEASFKVPR